MSETTIAAPSTAKRSEMARPHPLPPAPVTITTRFSCSICSRVRLVAANTFNGAVYSHCSLCSVTHSKKQENLVADTYKSLTARAKLLRCLDYGRSLSE